MRNTLCFSKWQRIALESRSETNANARDHVIESEIASAGLLKRLLQLRLELLNQVEAGLAHELPVVVQLEAGQIALVGAALRDRRLRFRLLPLLESPAARLEVQVQRRDLSVVKAQLCDVEAVELLGVRAVGIELALLPLPRVVDLNALPRRAGWCGARHGSARHRRERGFPHRLISAAHVYAVL